MNAAAMRGSGRRTDPPNSVVDRSLLLSIPADRYRILGVRVHLRTDSDEIRTFFSHAYRWFPGDGGSADLELAAVLDGGAGGAPFAAAGETIIDLSETASRENRAFLFLLESIMDRIDGSIVLHAAATARNGRGVMLAGPALAGKSTLVQELMKLGHGFLSDDAAPLDRSTGLLLPFPRAVGVRKPEKDDGGTKPEGLPAKGLHELPHRWLVDPEALGAELPARPCRPRFLFYLDPEEAAASSSADRRFHLALAADSDEVRGEVRDLAPLSVTQLPGQPFPTLEAVFAKGARPVAGLTDLWRRHRQTILYIEEVRAAKARRRSGPPRIEETPVSNLLLALVREVLNRGEGSRLMASHGGRITSLTMELAALLRDVRCFKVRSGSPRENAAAIDAVAGRR